MNSFSEELAKYLQVSKYSRYNEQLKRRETWEESTIRNRDMHLRKYNFLNEEDKQEIIKAFELIKEKKILPSMRSMQFGGIAIEAHNERMYNCAVRHIDSIRALSEVFFLLLCGSGVSFGITNRFLFRFPDLVSAKDKTGIVQTYVIEDTIEGWANSVEVLLSCYLKNTPYTGRKIIFDYSRIRPKGSPLKIGGGKAPGYEGLKSAHKKIKSLLDFIIEEKEQKRLQTINVYDILMHCADAVLSGGIRRAATSVMFDETDTDMMNAKVDFDVLRKGRFELNEKTGKYEGYVIINDTVYRGKKRMEVKISEFEYKYLEEHKKISWIHVHPHRARSNNSVMLLRNELSFEEFSKYVNISKMYGEPGFVFVNNLDVLYNPCFEIGFMAITDDGVCGVQFCNLTTQNGSKIKTKEDFYLYCKYSSIIGTLQAGYTDFPFLSPVAKQLTEEESLLGCSITGIFNNPEILLNPEILRTGAEICVETNRIWADKIGINQAARVTALKPEGTGSLAIAEENDIPSPGIHAHHSRKYFRRVQANKSDPIYKYFKKHNPHMCEESVWSANKTDDVITFPIIIEDENVITKEYLTALKHLEYIKLVQQNWVIPGTTEVNEKDITHNVSCTVDVRDEEWEDVINYLYENKEYFSAVSLLPVVGDKLYPQAPLERILTKEDEEKFQYYVDNYKTVDYTKLIEKEDNTQLQTEITCAGGKCDINI